MADASFVTPLYFRESHSAAAIKWMQQRSWLEITSLTILEVHNALQLRVFRQEATLFEARKAREAFASDIANGTYRSRVMSAAMFERAVSLSLQFGARLGCRSLDILNVASAVELQCDELLTFDKRQRDLAVAAGLKTNLDPFQ